MLRTAAAFLLPMVLLAALAGWWSKPPASLRSAVMVLSAVVVFALVSYGVDVTRSAGTRAAPPCGPELDPASAVDARVSLVPRPTGSTRWSQFGSLVRLRRILGAEFTLIVRSRRRHAEPTRPGRTVNAITTRQGR